MMSSELPFAMIDSAGVVSIVTNGTTGRLFDPAGGGSFTPAQLTCKNP